MSKGYWRGPIAFVAFGIVLAVIAGILIWDSSAILTEQRVPYEQAASAYAEQATDRIEQNCGADLDAAAMRSCIREEMESSEDGKRSERDLDAQEVMARFTRIMGYTGLIGLIVGLGSVYLIWATLRETQVMASDTRRIGEAQARAYLTVDKCTVWPVPSRDVVTWSAKITVRNTGQSPARNVHCILDFRKVASKKGVLPDLPSNGDFTATITIQTPTDVLIFNEPNDTEVAILLDLTVKYQDVFCSRESVRYEHFCFGGYVHLVPDEETELSDFSAVGRFNQSDQG